MVANLKRICEWIHNLKCGRDDIKSNKIQIRNMYLLNILRFENFPAEVFRVTLSKYVRSFRNGEKKEVPWYLK